MDTFVCAANNNGTGYFFFEVLSCFYLRRFVNIVLIYFLYSPVVCRRGLESELP